MTCVGCPHNNTLSTACLLQQADRAWANTVQIAEGCQIFWKVRQ